MQIDPAVQLKATIRPGSVFLFADADYSKSKPHYYVVLNHTPLKDKTLLLVCSVTLDNDMFCNIENSPYPYQTFVDVTPKQCTILKNNSVFDCNRVKERAIENLINKLSNKELKLIGYIETDVLNKLREAAIMSPAVENEFKILLQR